MGACVMELADDAGAISNDECRNPKEALGKVLYEISTGKDRQLDHRGQTASGRPVISERGFVATRQGIDGLREQLHASPHTASRPRQTRSASPSDSTDLGRARCWRTGETVFHSTLQYGRFAGLSGLYG